MEIFYDPVFLSRLQFAVTAMFHMLWPLTTIGLSLILVIFEGLWLKTGDVDNYQHARFWAKLFLLVFTMGVVSGIPLQFEFGTNWSRFSIMTGEFFGNILGYEAAMAFMLEAGFLGIMLFGWTRVPPAIHCLATAMVAAGASLSAFWILVANSWMQTPAGIHSRNRPLSELLSYFGSLCLFYVVAGIMAEVRSHGFFLELHHCIGFNNRCDNRILSLYDSCFSNIDPGCIFEQNFNLYAFKYRSVDSGHARL